MSATPEQIEAATRRWWESAERGYAYPKLYEDVRDTAPVRDRCALIARQAEFLVDADHVIVPASVVPSNEELAAMRLLCDSRTEYGPEVNAMAVVDAWGALRAYLDRQVQG